MELINNDLIENHRSIKSIFSENVFYTIIPYFTELINHERATLKIFNGPSGTTKL